MRIAQVIPSLEARHGGPSRSVRGLSEGLAREGRAVDLLTTGPLDDHPPSGSLALTLRAFEREWPRFLACSTPLQRHLEAQPYDIVHHHSLWQRTLHYASRASRRGGIPLVISPRGMMSPWAWNHHRWRKAFAACGVHPGAFATAAGWHATSEAEADDIRRLGFTQPICVAPNGVVPPSEEEERLAARYWHERIPELNGRPVVLFYSRLHAKKRVLELIDLWISKPRGNWLLLLVGIPEQYTVAQLEAYVARKGGAGHVTVHDGAGGPPPYAVASLFVLPSHSENFGLVIAEALVRGVPVLATDATPWSALAREGAGACVAWSAYGSALDELLASSPETLRAKGDQARRWARAAFSWDNSAALVADFYDRLISAR